MSFKSTNELPNRIGAKCLLIEVRPTRAWLRPCGKNTPLQLACYCIVMWLT